MRVLIANPYGIGDVLFSLPLLHALRKSDPEGFVGYLSNGRTAEMVERCFPVDWHTSFEKDEFRALWKRSPARGTGMLLRLIRSIQRQRFDALIDLSLGWHYSFGGALAGIPKRAGFNFKNRGRFLTDRLEISGFHSQPVPQYYLDLLPLLGVTAPEMPDVRLELPPGAEAEAERFLSQQGISAGNRLVGIVPGGGASWGPNAVYKQWPGDRFARVADHAARRYGAVILLLGNSKEAELCGSVATKMQAGHPKIIRAPSLLVLAAVLKRCALVVGNDSGPLQMANFLRVPTVTIFGPVDGSVYGAFPANARQRPVVNGLACRPCYRGFRFPPCPWDNACLKGLEPEQVIRTMEEVLP